MNSKDGRDWRRELKEAGWREVSVTLYQAPCGCYFRGPWRAWTEMNGTHLADHIAAGASVNQGAAHDR